MSEQYASGLVVRDVRLHVAGRLLLDRVSFDAQRGECVAIIGANGAGKTTLLRAIAGLWPATGGDIMLDANPLPKQRARERARRVALVTADEALFDGMTVREAVAAGRYAHHPWWDWHASLADESAIDGALDSVGLEGLAMQSMGTLSTGERGRAWMALALAQDAELLLLDEPTSHLDVRYAIEALELLRRVVSRGRIAVVALHSLEEAAEFADRVVVLGERTMLAFGRPRDVLDEPTLARAYGVTLDVVVAGGGLLFRRKLPER
ncbi:MAG: ABC transporter ATP-binding protein [Candidatus Eremiobacteraeota bacterium]|nr:ABC transporter ATP-binding protein [Candidatus Eremiobacteraeota bacterium]